MVPFQDDRSMVQSLFSRIMAAARERSAATMWRFLEGCGDFDSDDDDEDDDDHILCFDLSRPAPRIVNNSAVKIPGLNPTPPAPPKRRRSKHPRKNQKDALWYKDYLTPALRAELTLQPHGRLAAIFRRDFHAPFALFQKLVQLAKDRCITRWNIMTFEK